MLKQLLTLMLLITLAFVSRAATYKIDIDYHHPSLSYTDSKSGITLVYLGEQGTVIHEETVPGIYPITPAVRSFTFSTERIVQMVAVKIAGNDAFFIDRMVIWKDGKRLQEYGAEGGTGWCLSTDPNDSYGGWAKHMEGGCQSTRAFVVDNQIHTPYALGDQSVTATIPDRQPGVGENGWIYYDNEQRSEINAEGLGRCYDIRYIDPINWSNETLQSGQRASVISLVRDDARRPARHNNRDHVVPKGVVFTSEIIGDSEAESKFAATSYEYENEVLEDYRADIGIPKGGSAKVSAAFKDVSIDAGSNSSLYAFSKMYKQFYKLDLYFDDPAHQHYLDARFWNGVRELGQGLSASEFIRKFGTHYASTTYYGGNFFQRRAVNQSEYGYYESNESNFKADVEGTIKKVNFDVGTTQGIKNRAGETERVEMSSAKIYTVGGDLNQYRPDLWARSVLKNLAVVKVRLTRISDLLTPENFPEISNIREKQRLLTAAILVAEQEAQFSQSDYQKHSFFTKKPATFRLTVTYMKCRGHGSKEPGGNSEYYGNVKMGMFNRNGKALKTRTCFKRGNDKPIDLALNQTYDLNKSITYKVGAADISNGYISVYGSMKEKDLAEIQLSTISHHATSAKIHYRNALDAEVSKKVFFTSKHGDKVEVHFKLRKL